MSTSRMSSPHRDAVSQAVDAAVEVRGQDNRCAHPFSPGGDALHDPCPRPGRHVGPRDQRGPGALWDDQGVTSPALEQELPSRAHHLPAAGLVVVATGGTAALSAAQGELGQLVAVAVLQLALLAAWVVATGIRGRV